MKCNIYSIFFLLLFSLNCSAQDSLYARKVINTLTSESFHGRGYLKNGDKKAAKYIEEQYCEFHLKHFNDYFQPFAFPVNTFPKVDVSIDGHKLIPGVDYIVYPSSGSSYNNYELKTVDSSSTLEALADNDASCLVIDNKVFNAFRDKASDLLAQKTKGAVIFLEDTKLTWSVGRDQYKIPVIVLLKKSLPASAYKISFNIKAVFKKQHDTQNVIGYVEGTTHKDSFIVFSAHYDHLGMMGKKAYFPGANDNASGVAMLLNLAQYYSKKENSTGCSILFIAFAGEEAGLVGSHYYTEHPLFDLHKIKFLVNLDLLGTGDEGMMVVNATECKPQYEALKSINAEKKYLSVIGERGKARNSDHYFFSEKGVPSFFFYTLGGIKAYHDVYDKAETLPLTKFKEVFLLIRDFTRTLQ